MTALIRLILRRDRFWLPLYVLSLAGFVSATVATIRGLLPTPEDRRLYAEEIVINPVILLLQGPAYAHDVGAMAVQQRGAATTILAALGSVILLVKHTRADEEKGRRELVGAGAIGRQAPLTAALAVVFAANAVLAVLIGLAGVAAGLPMAGSLAWGLMVAAAGWFAAALAAVLAQVTESSGGAGGGAIGIFFLLHIVRGVSDAEGPSLDWLGWLVPNGWLLRARAFAGERWWVFLLVVLLVAGLLAVAYALSARRDVGAGLIPARPGPARASYGLRGPFSLAWRLHREAAVTWIAAAGFVGIGMGVAAQGAIERFAQSGSLVHWAGRMGTADPAEVFFGLMVYVLASFAVSLYAILAVTRLHGEERELLLTGPLGRVRWAMSHLVIALAVPAAMLLLAGVGLGMGTEDYGRMLGITLNLLPAVWVMVGVALAAFGLVRRAGLVIAWVALALIVVLEVGWEIGVLSDAWFMISPFAHVHYSVIADPGPGTYAGLTLVAALLIATGLTALRRRDLVV